MSDDKVVNGLRFAETIRNLDDRMALKIALILAGNNPELFAQYAEVARKQNLQPIRAPRHPALSNDLPTKIS